MCCANSDLQSLILLSMLRRRPLQPSVKAAPGDLEHFGHDRYGVLASPRLHERVPCSDSLAKYAAAFFTMSPSIRICANSFRGCLFSLSSSATVRAPGIPTVFPPRALATHPANVPLGTEIRSVLTRFRDSMAGLHDRHPRGYLSTARGRCGSLHLHRNALAPSPPRGFPSAPPIG